MFVIVIDLYDEFLKNHNEDIDGIYETIASFFDERGFTKLRDGVYLSDKDVNAVSATVAVEELASRRKWFALTIKSAKLLRVEEESDLIDAIRMFK